MTWKLWEILPPTMKFVLISRKILHFGLPKYDKLDIMYRESHIIDSGHFVSRCSGVKSDNYL